LPFRFDEETLQRGLNFTLSTELGDLDLLGEVTGIGDYTAVLATSEPVELFDRTFNVLALDALIPQRELPVVPKTYRYCRNLKHYAKSQMRMRDNK
jgi:hypothetical protein